MRSRTFEVPVDVLPDFVKVICEEEMPNAIEGITDDDEVQISVDYEPDQKQVIDDLHDLIDTFNEENQDDDEDEDDDD
jgi:hypothetical protein